MAYVLQVFGQPDVLDLAEKAFDQKLQRLQRCTPETRFDLLQGGDVRLKGRGPAD